jgi:hypothetical protein
LTTEKGVKPQKKKLFFDFTLVTEEFTRDVQFFTTNNNHLLTIQSLLGNDGSKTTEEVTFTVNDNNLKYHF